MREEAISFWIFKEVDPDFQRVIPRNQHGQMHGYRIQIGYSDRSGPLDQDLRGLDAGIVL